MHTAFLNQQAKKELAIKELKELTVVLKGNHTSMVVMTSDEYLDFILLLKVRSGMNFMQAIDWVSNVISRSSEISVLAKNEWNAYKELVKSAGSYLPAVLDAVTLVALAKEMKKGGDIFGKYKVSAHPGPAYIVLEGYSGLREKLQGTKYLASNPQVVSMGVGKLGVAKSIKGGIIVSVIFSVAFHSLDQLLNDKATWHDFVAGVSVDIVTAATGGAIAWGMVSAVLGGAAMVAIGPIAFVVVAGTGLAWALSVLGNHFEVTERIATMLKESEARVLQNLQQIHSEVRKGLNYADEDPVGFMHRLFAVPYLGR